MKPEIYKLACTSKGHPYVLSGALPVGYFDQFFNGRQLPAGWRPPEHSVRGERNKSADIVAWKEALPLLSARAVEVFESIAPGCAEYKLFTEIKREPFFVINVLAAEDSSDDPPVFKPRERFYEPVLVTRAIPEAVVAHRLIGFQFRNPFISETSALFHNQNTNIVPGILP